MDLNELSNGVYYRAGKEPEMRLRARLDELLKNHQGKIAERFAYYQSKEFYVKLQRLIQPYSSVHLPNVIDFNMVYQLIESEWDFIFTTVKDLVDEV